MASAFFYYLSMEFLIGLVRLSPIIHAYPITLCLILCTAAVQKSIGLVELVEQEPDAGLATEVWPAAACFLDSMATMQLPATGYGLRYRVRMFKQSIVDGLAKGDPNWLRDNIHGKCPAARRGWKSS